MSLLVRPFTEADVPEGGRILFEAFGHLADHHRFERDFPSAEVTSGLLGMVAAHPGFWTVAAEQDGRLLGSNVLEERSLIHGVGPISVDPHAQNRGVGRALMQAVIDRSASRGAPGIRLHQAAYHNRSLCLYATLGFRAREPVSVMQGAPLGIAMPGRTVRPAAPEDAAACNALCAEIHGFHRGGELADAIAAGTARVVEHAGEITGYTTIVAFFGHSVGRTNEDLMALIGEADGFPGFGFLVPTRNHALFSWCLSRGLRLMIQMTLMTIGLYNEPQGAWMPSVTL